MSKVFGGQTYKPSVFPPVKYLESLTKAYFPDLDFDPVKWKKAFHSARYPEFDAAFSAVTEDGASCDMQLCWCLLEMPAGTVLPLHAHKNLEVSYTLRGTMKERTVPGAFIPMDSLSPQEIDYLGHADAQMVDKSYPAGSMVLYAPGSFHQVYTDKSEGCVLLILYSKNCTFIRATAPSIARQLLGATADKHASFAAPVVRKPSSFVNMGPRYARYRASMGKVTTVTCAQVAVKALADCGVRDVILYPGAKCIELLKVVDNNHYGIRGWLCRNEHAGAFVAEGYNKSQSERLCCVMTTSGPGATNLCTGIASCWRDGVPLVVITSQVPSYKKGTAAFQETPTAELYRPITKASFEITSTAEVYDTVIAACRIAVDGINGPVIIDIPEDLQAEMVTLPPNLPCTSGSSTPQSQPCTPSGGRILSSCASGKITMPLHSPFTGVLAPRDLGLRSHVACPVRQSLLKKVLGYVKAAQRPLLLLGGGCVKCDEEVLNELVDVLGMPVVYTFMGKGCISDDHELCLGPIGVHGLYTANTAIQRCDLLLALGCRFDERAACKSFDLWEEPVTTIHVDIVKQEKMSGSSKGHPISLSVAADVQDFVGALLQHLYGLIDECRQSTMGSLEEELKSFVVDEEDVRVLRESGADYEATVVTASATVLETEGSLFLSNSHSCNGCHGPPPLNGVAAGAAGVDGLANGSANGWHLYSGWSKEMTELKQRRWRSLMPCLSPKSELTTREMVHLLDSFLNNKGIEAIVCSDVGSHQCLLTQYLRLHHPRQWLMEGGLASMGCGLPAAIGAAMANPQATCLAVAGDGGFAMTSQELIMAKVYKLNVKVIVTVNNRLQLVEQLEEETYDSLDVYTFLGDPDHPHRPYPNFAMLAQAYGVPSVTAWNQQELLDGLALMFANPGPFLMEVVALAERPHIKYWDSTEQ